LAHVDGALQPEAGTHGCGRHAMLPCSGLGDYPSLTHALRQPRLAERTVDLVGSSVIEVFTLQIDLAADFLGQPGLGTQRRRTTDVFLEESVQLFLELRIADGLVERQVELVEGGNEGFRNVPTSESTETVDRVSRQLVRP